MNLKKLNISEKFIRITAAVMCVILISVYMTSDILAKYTSSGSGSDSIGVASLGEISISGTNAFVTDYGITPGVDIPISLTVSNTAKDTDVPSWVILAFKLGDYWDLDSANNRLYLNQNKALDFKHEVNQHVQIIYFDIDTTVVNNKYNWVNAGTSNGYAFFAQRIEAGATSKVNQPNVIKNNTLYVSSEINTDDIIAINTFADSITVKPYLVSQYGYSSNASLPALCQQLYTEVISKE